METTKALTDVLEQRKNRTITVSFKEGTDQSYDDVYLAMAAPCYIKHAIKYAGIDASPLYKMISPPAEWPFSEKCWKPESVRQDLIHAVNLLIDEIESIDRMAEGA